MSHTDGERVDGITWTLLQHVRACILLQKQVAQHGQLYDLPTKAQRASPAVSTCHRDAWVAKRQHGAVTRVSRASTFGCCVRAAHGQRVDCSNGTQQHELEPVLPSKAVATSTAALFGCADGSQLLARCLDRLKCWCAQKRLPQAAKSHASPPLAWRVTRLLRRAACTASVRHLASTPCYKCYKCVCAMQAHALQPGVPPGGPAVSSLERAYERRTCCGMRRQHVTDTVLRAEYASATHHSALQVRPSS